MAASAALHHGADESRLRDLLNRALDSGDSVAYRSFLETTGILLRRYIEGQLRRTGRPSADAEDIVQEAMLAIHAKRYTYDGNAPVTAWLYAIARYKLIDHLRSSARVHGTMPLAEIEDVATVTEPMEERILAGQLLSSLSPRLRASVLLTKVDGLSVAETAAASGLSEASVKVNVHRGIRAMARLFHKDSP